MQTIMADLKEDEKSQNVALRQDLLCFLKSRAKNKVLLTCHFAPLKQSKQIFYNLEQSDHKDIL